MPRFHNINGEKVQFTAEEEVARDAEEKAWVDGALNRALARVRKTRNDKRCRRCIWFIFRCIESKLERRS